MGSHWYEIFFLQLAPISSRPYIITSVCRYYQLYYEICNNTTEHIETQNNLTTLGKVSGVRMHTLFIKVANRRRDQSPRDHIVHVYVSERNYHHGNSQRHHHRSVEMFRFSSIGQSAGWSIADIRRMFWLFLSGRKERFSVDFDEHCLLQFCVIINPVILGY